MKKRKKQTKNHGLLSQRVERTLVPPRHESGHPDFDSADPDLLSYVSAFVDSFAQIPKMEPFSLRTRASAEEALKMLEARHADLQTRLKTARTLKRLLENERQFKEH